jgi:hypothetical protein
MKESLLYELTKQTVTLDRVKPLDGVFSSFGKCNTAVYGIKPRHGFPENCNPKKLEYISYMGVSTFNDRIHLIDFLYEEKYEDDHRIGILEPGLKMLSDELKTKIVPRHIPNEWVDFWKNYFKYEFNDRETIKCFVEELNIQGCVDWTELYNALPDDIDLNNSN